MRALGEAVPPRGELDPRTARDLVILNLLDRGDITLDKPRRAMGTQADHDKVWKEVDSRRRAGERRIEDEGLVFDFSGAAQAPLPRRRSA